MAHGHQLSTGQRHGARPISPTGDVAAKRVQVAARNRSETALNRVTHGHLARAGGNNRRNHRTDCIGNNRARARNLNRRGRAQEQARTQRQAHRNHGQLTVGQGTTQRIALRLLRGILPQCRHNVSLSLGMLCIENEV